MAQTTRSAAAILPLAALFDLRRERHRAPVLHVAARRAGGRWRVSDAASGHAEGMTGGWWALPRAESGDSPRQYHPLYVAAILSARAAPPAPPVSKVNRPPLARWPIPRIAWTTSEEVRRSMTLNGMRMSLEYVQTGSPRVLQLVESRLSAGQRDVAHDVLVYLMRQVMDVRAREREARDLRAESVAAYLGLYEPRVRLLFAARRLTAAAVSAAIAAGFAGPVRRVIDVEALVQSQLHHLRPQLRALRHEEEKLLRLLDEIAARLYVGSGGICVGS